MGRLIEIRDLHQARRRRSEKVSMEQCVELLEWNLKKSLDDYFSSPREERSMRATQIRKLHTLDPWNLQRPCRWSCCYLPA
jgi:hypothetical protein